MPKLLIFDLDGTLAPIGSPSAPSTVEALKGLERRGCRIAICSGKPLAYLCGYMRQIGLKQPILLGENGADIQFGIDYPPKKHFTLKYSDAAKKAIQDMRERISKSMPQIWFQPNQVELTPFFGQAHERNQIRGILNLCMETAEDVEIYEHVDCFDVIPIGVNKQAGVLALAEYLGISCADLIAIGDGVNDYPMFEIAGYSIGIHLKDSAAVTSNVPTIAEAMSLLVQIID